MLKYRGSANRIDITEQRCFGMCKPGLHRQPCSIVLRCPHDHTSFFVKSSWEAAFIKKQPFYLSLFPDIQLSNNRKTTIHRITNAMMITSVNDSPMIVILLLQLALT